MERTRIVRIKVNQNFVPEFRLNNLLSDLRETDGSKRERAFQRLGNLFRNG